MFAIGRTGRAAQISRAHYELATSDNQGSSYGIAFVNMHFRARTISSAEKASSSSEKLHQDFYPQKTNSNNNCDSRSVAEHQLMVFDSSIVR